MMYNHGRVIPHCIQYLERPVSSIFKEKKWKDIRGSKGSSVKCYVVEEL